MNDCDVRLTRYNIEMANNAFRKKTLLENATEVLSFEESVVVY